MPEQSTSRDLFERLLYVAAGAAIGVGLFVGIQRAARSDAMNPPSRGPRIPSALTAPTIVFRSGSAEITPDVASALDALVPVLAESTEARFDVVGRGDPSAPADSALAARRATAVVTYLVARGVDSARLRAVPDTVLLRQPERHRLPGDDVIRFRARRDVEHRR